jgi:hypothetical protein
MQYLVRRNFRHNGKLFEASGKPIDIAVLDEPMRIRLRAGVIQAVKVEPKAKGPKKNEGSHASSAPQAPAHEEAKKDSAPENEAKTGGGILGKIFGGGK